MLRACSVHDPPELWSQSDQKTATKIYTMISRPSAPRPSLLNICFTKPQPAGGMWTNFLRPAQKKIVAMNIATPGIPNAHRGPQFEFASMSGQRMVERNEPALIEK